MKNDPTQPPQRGIKAHSAATMAELREFLSQVRGRSPQEMLGIIAASGLARGMMLSTVIIAFLVLAGTALPFTWNKIAGKPKKQQPAAAAPADDTDDGEAKKTEPVEPKAKKTSEKEDILDKLGIGETKKLPKKGFNPLENRVDDILKDLDK